MLIGCVSAFTGCGKSAKYKIGILLYNFTDIQGQEISAYADYLEEDFDVEFVKVSVGQDDDSHIQGLESCLNQGCNAVFSGYNTAIDTCVEMCEEAGVYYGLILGDTQTTELSEKTLTSKYYLGGVKQFSGDPSKVGKQFAELLNGSEYTEIAGLSFPPFAFIDGTTLWNAMVEDLGEGKQIKSAETKPCLSRSTIRAITSISCSRRTPATRRCRRCFRSIPTSKCSWPWGRAWTISFPRSVSTTTRT